MMIRRTSAARRRKFPLFSMYPSARHCATIAFSRSASSEEKITIGSSGTCCLTSEQMVLPSRVGMLASSNSSDGFTADKTL
jgi:hypothetical protein